MSISSLRRKMSYLYDSRTKKIKEKLAKLTFVFSAEPGLASASNQVNQDQEGVNAIHYSYPTNHT